MAQSNLQDGDQGIFALTVIGNFECGPKADFFSFTLKHNLWQNSDVPLTLLWQTC